MGYVCVAQACVWTYKDELHVLQGKWLYEPSRANGCTSPAVLMSGLCGMEPCRAELEHEKQGNAWDAMGDED